MKLLHSLVVLLTLGVVSAAAEDLSSHVSEDTLKREFTHISSSCRYKYIYININNIKYTI